MPPLYVSVIYPADLPHQPKSRRIYYRPETQESDLAILEEVYRQFNHVDGSEFVAFVEPPVRSLSVGDVVAIEGVHFVCVAFGWVKMKDDAVQDWINNTPFADRSFLSMGLDKYEPKSDDLGLKYEDIELSDGGCIEHPHEDGTIRRRGVHGKVEEIRQPGHSDYDRYYDAWARYFGLR